MNEIQLNVLFIFKDKAMINNIVVAVFFTDSTVKNMIPFVWNKYCSVKNIVCFVGTWYDIDLNKCRTVKNVVAIDNFIDSIV